MLRGMANQKNENDRPRRHPQVANLAEADGTTLVKGTRYHCQMKWLGRATGARGIGCTWYEVPPGATAFPHHFHCATEESLYVLEGSGSLRLGSETFEIGAGDYVAFLPGPDSAHQLKNTGDGPLRYLCMSTMQRAEVVVYPDSGKIGASGWSGEPGSTPWVRKIFKEGSAVDYYDGEKID